MIEFSIVVKTNRPGSEIFNAIFDIANWQSFNGWGVIPGIKKVELTEINDSRVGNLFQVENTNGSTHHETVLDYIPDRKLVMKIDHFSAPLNKLNTHFIETWEIDGAYLKRRFELHPRNKIGGLLLMPLGVMLKRAISIHTREIFGQ
jgi:hypothetical protein